MFYLKGVIFYCIKLLLWCSISSNSSISFPASLAALATKYGGSSPKAVPKPHRNDSIYTANNIVWNDILSVG